MVDVILVEPNRKCVFHVTLYSLLWKKYVKCHKFHKMILIQHALEEFLMNHNDLSESFQRIVQIMLIQSGALNLMCRWRAEGPFRTDSVSGIVSGIRLSRKIVHSPKMEITTFLAD